MKKFLTAILNKIKFYLNPECDATWRLKIQLRKFVINTGCLPDIIILTSTGLQELKDSSDWRHWPTIINNKATLKGIPYMILDEKLEQKQFLKFWKKEKKAVLVFDEKL